MIGLHVTLSGESWSVGATKSTWDAETVSWSENCKWSEDDRSKGNDEIVRYVSKLLKLAKVRTVADLKGIPVEVTLEGNGLKEWRILTEVL